MKIYTSYLAKADFVRDKRIVTINITRYAPKFDKSPLYQLLAPDSKTLWDYKNGGTQAAYEKEFKEKLSKLNAQSVIQQLATISGGQDLALMCYEKTGDFCHRHLVAQWLNESGFLDDPVEELKI